MLSICLLDRFTVRHGDRLLGGIHAGKEQELLCYLLLYRDRPHKREMLVDQLWGDSATNQSKKQLRQVLWHLQAALNSCSETDDTRVLLVEPGWVRINPRAPLWLDVAILEAAYDTVQGLPGRELDAATVRSVQEAVQLYGGDLLQGWYQDWCVYERNRLQDMYLAMLDKLMGYCEAHNQYETGVVYGSRILRYDRSHERTHRRLMRLYYLAGDRTAALRQYERCVAALHEELAVKPARRTVALHEQIRADQLDDPAQLPIFTVGEPPAPSLPEVLRHLNQFQALLSEMQHQVQRDIQVVETALGHHDRPVISPERG